jgi:hypothetical protein
MHIVSVSLVARQSLLCKENQQQSREPHEQPRSRCSLLLLMRQMNISARRFPWLQVSSAQSLSKLGCTTIAAMQRNAAKEQFCKVTPVCCRSVTCLVAPQSLPCQESQQESKEPHEEPSSYCSLLLMMTQINNSAMQFPCDAGLSCTKSL